MVVRPAASPPDEEGIAELFEYWMLIGPWLSTILKTTLAAILATLAITSVIMPKWYRGQALIRPASQQGPTYEAGIVNAAGIGTLSPINSLRSTLGLGSGASDAQEHLALLQSYDFTISVVNNHRLTHHIVPTNILTTLKTWLGFEPHSRWRQYRKMRDRFDCAFDDKAGNLTISFLDRDPLFAKRVLLFYIDDLRERLRARAIRDASDAAKALSDEISRTSDPLLSQQLNVLVAQQIQAAKTAQVQADFAFTVIEPPFVPSTFDSPRVGLDCILVGLLTPLTFVLALTFRSRIYTPLQERRRRVQTSVMLDRPGRPNHIDQRSRIRT